MANIKVEQEDLQKGYTVIESIHAILGVGTARVVAMRGGTHPKMRLKVKDEDTLMDSGDGLSGDYSFVLVNVAAVSGAITVSHKDGVVAGETVATVNTADCVYPIAIAATTDETIFEADEDVMIAPSTVLGAATASLLVVLKFEVVD